MSHDDGAGKKNLCRRPTNYDHSASLEIRQPAAGLVARLEWRDIIRLEDDSSAERARDAERVLRAGVDLDPMTGVNIDGRGCPEQLRCFDETITSGDRQSRGVSAALAAAREQVAAPTGAPAAPRPGVAREYTSLTRNVDWAERFAAVRKRTWEPTTVASLRGRPRSHRMPQYAYATLS